MIYLLALLCFLALGIACLACRLIVGVSNDLKRQREMIDLMYEQIQGQWKGHNYFHAQTRALISGDEAPRKEDFWAE